MFNKGDRYINNYFRYYLILLFSIQTFHFQLCSGDMLENHFRKVLDSYIGISPEFVDDQVTILKTFGPSHPVSGFVVRFVSSVLCE